MKQTWQECFAMTLGRPVQIGWPKQKVPHRNTLNESKAIFWGEINHEGEIFDFHCLRHTFGAWLAMQGTHPKVVQEATRHQSITLTKDTYGHLFPGQEVEAVRRLGTFLDNPESQPQAMRATNTHQHGSSAQLLAQQSGRENVPLAAQPCQSIVKEGQQRKTPKPLNDQGLSDKCPVISTDAESSSGGIRTPDTRIMIPLL